MGNNISECEIVVILGVNSSRFLLPNNETSGLWQGLKNPLARRLELVISTFGLAEIISCMPDGLVKIYIGY
jgi:hypothetical protein